MTLPDSSPQLHDEAPANAEQPTLAAYQPPALVDLGPVQSMTGTYGKYRQSDSGTIQVPKDPFYSCDAVC